MLLNLGTNLVLADPFLDITAQVALLTARGALKLAVPDDHANLARWYAAVSSRPTARA